MPFLDLFRFLHQLCQVVNYFLDNNYMMSSKQKIPKKKRYIHFPMNKSDHDTNVLLDAIGTKECLKVKKKDKKIPIENIFIKK